MADRTGFRQLRHKRRECASGVAAALKVTRSEAEADGDEQSRRHQLRCNLQRCISPDRI
jgi:hypothetical protein